MCCAKVLLSVLSQSPWVTLSYSIKRDRRGGGILSIQGSPDSISGTQFLLCAVPIHWQDTPYVSLRFLFLLSEPDTIFLPYLLMWNLVQALIASPGFLVRRTVWKKMSLCFNLLSVTLIAQSLLSGYVCADHSVCVVCLQIAFLVSNHLFCIWEGCLSSECSEGWHYTCSSTSSVTVLVIWGVRNHYIPTFLTDCLGFTLHRGVPPEPISIQFPL